ncbi:MAG: magnesium-translocating P-type ATPase [Chloroflexota bacterium]|nr:magnesium-translocating P-type ATPase [Chloroflexota bacterium]
MSVGELLAALATDEGGLTAAEASSRLRRVGPNEPIARRTSQLARRMVGFAASPLVLILLAACAVSAALGDVANATIIATMVVLSGALTMVQTYRSERAAEELRGLVAPTATVLRDRAWSEVPQRGVVPGDVIRLGAGDLVPADARILQERELHVQQAALTGESLPVEKEARPGAPPDVAVTDREDMVFIGTSVLSGTATAVVVHTGRETIFGGVSRQLATRPPDTEFERGARLFGLLIMRTVFFLVLFVVLVGIVARRDPFESLLFGIALAVGLTPEFLPMITTVTLGAGALRMARSGVIVKDLSAIENFGSMDVLCSDKTNTLTTGEMRVDRSLGPFGEARDDALRLAALNSAFQTGVHSPLDAAILARTTPEAGWTKVDEVPFDFVRRRLSVVVEHGGRRLLVTKGAPESVLDACGSLGGGGAPLGAPDRARALAVFDELSGEGSRVLAVAARPVPVQARYGPEDETALSLAGFVAFLDPPLEGVGSVLESLRRDGIEFKVLTGDSDAVARHVCAAIGMDTGEIVLGGDLARVSDAALGVLAERTTVFARVSPEQKSRILLALKRRGHVVGYLGDGVNDAPSLHIADVGVSVTDGVDVARDAASVILREGRLDVLHEGVVDGRKAFGNVVKYLLMGTSSNFGNMLSMAAASVFLPFLPMLPRQILLNNFLYDLAQITIPTDNVDATFTRKPRRWDIGMIQRFMILIGPISSAYDLLTFVVLLALLHASPPLFQTGWFVESLATQVCVIFVIRTAGDPWRSRPSLPLALSTLVVVAAALLLPFTPVAPVLGFVALPAAYFAFLAAAALAYLGMVEVVKRRVMGALIA